MSLHIPCDRCGKEIEVLGGLLWSPPDKNNKHDKTHLCIDCYEVVLGFVFQIKVGVDV